MLLCILGCNGEHKVLLLSLLILLQACSISPKYTDKSAPVEDRTTSQSTRSDNVRYNTKGPQDKKVISGQITPGNKPSVQSINRQATSTAVIALLDNAQYEINAGNTESAAAVLERALRLEPKNPFLWNRLAKLRLQKKIWHLAMTLAQKSNSLATSNYILQADNWSIIARAKLSMGDKNGAEKAQAISYKLLGASKH